jgi:ankyrin repeat protein
VSREPHLDFYRHRAKELLAQAKAGDSAALARFAQAHPDFRQGAGPPLALNQAQLVIAREDGFPSWPKLRAYIEAMERTREQSPADQIHALIRARDLEGLRGFIAKHPDAPHLRIEPMGDTPLHVAVEWREGTEVLLEAGADINAISLKADRTPLRWAIHCGGSDGAFALFLLSKGADPNVSSAPEKSTMQLAAYSMSTPLIRALAARGVPIDAFGAVALEDEQLVRQLATESPSTLTQRMRPFQNITITPLHLAAFHDLPRMTDVLLEAGAKPDDADEQGRTPIDLALHCGKRRSYERLLAHGCLPNADLLALVGSIERSERIAGLHSAIHGGQAEAVKAALAHDPTLLDQHFPDVWGTGGTFGATPLHWAAMAGQLDIARLLIAAGASLEIKDLTYGGTPLGWARQYRRREMAAFLEAHGKQ